MDGLDRLCKERDVAYVDGASSCLEGVAESTETLGSNAGSE
jgi:hypothetical protein